MTDFKTWIEAGNVHEDTLYDALDILLEGIYPDEIEFTDEGVTANTWGDFNNKSHSFTVDQLCNPREALEALKIEAELKLKLDEEREERIRNFRLKQKEEALVAGELAELKRLKEKYESVSE